MGSILNLAGVDVPDSLDGRSFLPAMLSRGQDWPRDLMARMERLAELKDPLYGWFRRKGTTSPESRTPCRSCPRWGGPGACPYAFCFLPLRRWSRYPCSMV